MLFATKMVQTPKVNKVQELSNLGSEEFPATTTCGCGCGYGPSHIGLHLKALARQHQRQPAEAWPAGLEIRGVANKCWVPEAGLLGWKFKTTPHPKIKRALTLSLRQLGGLVDYCPQESVGAL